MMRCAWPCLAVLPLAALALLPLPALAQTQGASWDWQLSEPFDLTVDVQVFATDPDTMQPEMMAGLQARGVFTICYVSVGTLEDWRGDVAAFPASVIGTVYPDWPAENFLDIRDTGTLLPLLQSRFEDCAARGFDAIEPDNMDVYLNDSGFDISAEDTVRFVTALSYMAHALDLQIGQKNLAELTPQLEPLMDFAIVEGCFADDWCEAMRPYAEAGKAIFAAEYEVLEADRADLCTDAAGRGISLIFKEYDLDARGARCP